MIPATREDSQSTMPDRVAPNMYGPHILAAKGVHIEFSVKCDDSHYTADLDREVFLDAVRKLGVIVIEESELPEVVREEGLIGSQLVVARFTSAEGTQLIEQRYADVNTENLRRRARAMLALAEFVDANPPVDKAKVRTLSALVFGATGEPSEVCDAIARDLLNSGKVEVTE